MRTMQSVPGWTCHASTLLLEELENARGLGVIVQGPRDRSSTLSHYRPF